MLEVEYQQFKENIIREIRQDEDDYEKLQDEIRALQKEISAHEAQAQTHAGVGRPVTGEHDAQVSSEDKRSTQNESQPTESVLPSTQAAPSVDATISAAHSRPTSLPYDRTLPPPSAQRNDYGPISNIPTFHQTTQPHNRTLPPPPGLSPMPPPIDIHAAHRRTNSGSVPGRGSPLPLPNAAPFQQYMPYNYQQPPWPAHQPYPPQNSPYANAQFYGHPQAARNPPPSHTTVPNQYPYYPQSAPVNHYSQAQPAWQAQFPQQPYAQSALSTPTLVQRREKASLSGQSGSSTPWKTKAAAGNSLRPPSPARPERDVSPLSDLETPVPATSVKSKSRREATDALKEEGTSSKRARSSRRTRAGSTASSARAQSSRSQSLVSHVSETNAERAPGGRRSQKIKPEPPSTPAPFQSDTELPQSSVRRRTRGNTITSKADVLARPNLKRKRDSVPPSSPLDALPSPEQVSFRGQQDAADANLVPVTKSFSRLGNQILNEVTTHKFAGIFAKALSEREAPGYKDLIFRPQDLKSIKVAITKGSKAANAAIEELEQHGSGTPTKAALGGGTVDHVEKTDDLVPPKGIVNSAQLEMEVVRMFANAVMFNPLPASERGLPITHFRASATPSSDGGMGFESDDGGIIRDTREMFEDVLRKILEFRSVEHSESVDEVV